MARVAQSRQRTIALYATRFRFVRDAVIFLFGLGGIFHETALTHSDRPDLIVLFGAMIGLPSFLRTDEFHRSGATKRTRSDDDDEEPRQSPTQRQRESDWLKMHHQEGEGYA